MNKYDLSVLIPARNEEFLSLTVANILQNKKGKTEVIVHLDGYWPDPPLPDHPDLTLIYSPEPIGQRAGTNKACKLSQAKYVMKIDAHCAVDEGFDVKMLADMQDNWTMIPTLYNLHMFDLVCEKCGDRQYQGPIEKYKNCDKCEGKRKREMVYKPRLNKKSTHYRFDNTLHFQYFGELGNRPGFEGDISETMSAQGSCFLLTREKYWDLNICDESHGSWGQQGTEVACATWLSGGRLVMTRKTWYSHLFRTQGGSFSFPYQLSSSEVEQARKYSRDMWFNNKHPKQVKPLSWLIEKFWPVPGWSEEDLAKLGGKPLTRGIVFYTDNRVSLAIAHKVQKNLRKAGLPIVNASLKPMPHFGSNIHLPLQRGMLTMFKQQLAALEASTADIIFMCEHDVLYHPSHFDFTPLRSDVFYYNVNVWKVDALTGHALRVDVCQQVSGLVAYRHLLIDEYKRRIVRVEKEGKFERGWGFEPGTKSIARGGFSDLPAENFKSAFPNIDIRGEHNVTANRWSKEEFRNQQNTIGWTESTLDKIQGWDLANTTFLSSKQAMLAYL